MITKAIFAMTKNILFTQRLAEETAKLQAEMKRSHTEQNRAMMQRLQAREQERTGDMVRHQMDNMMATLASERDNIRQRVCDEIRENMVRIDLRISSMPREYITIYDGLMLR